MTELGSNKKAKQSPSLKARALRLLSLREYSRRSERYGMRKIADELERAGVDSKQSAKLLATLKESEFQRAFDLWTRKYGVRALDQKEKARQYRFLASKGFSSEVVAKVIGGQTPD